jgi:hypothetical protein
MYLNDLQYFTFVYFLLGLKKVRNVKANIGKMLKVNLSLCFIN